MNTRIAATISANVELLEQGAIVLSRLDDHSYTRRCLMFDGQCVGGHVRHIVEFYEMLLNGIPTGRVDYDARLRDKAVQTDRTVAIDRLNRTAARLRMLDDRDLDRGLAVSSEGSKGTYWHRSSVGREFEATRSHTVHHYALIAMLFRYFGLRVPQDFGVSKATLQFRTSAKLAEAA